MNRPLQVAHPPAKPVLLYDEDCGFCVLWVRRWEQATKNAVDYVPLQADSVYHQFPELSRNDLQRAVHLIQTNGSVCQGAEAVFRSQAGNSWKRWLSWLYDKSAWFARTSEWTYQFVAGHRPVFSWITRVGWGTHVERSPDYLTRWLFLRGLGIVYLIAFVSLWVQLPGLIGQNGVLPAANLMSQAQQAVEANGLGLDRFRLLPTLCWFNASDTFLQMQCAAGTVLAVLLIIGLAPPVCLVGLWLLYLSLATAGQVFLGYQWDNLLLETGVLAIFLAPLQLLPRPSRERPPSRLGLWLLRLVLFKLMFLSGVVKLASEDVTWRSLTALTQHYETQPLPSWPAWFAHQLPLWFQKTSCFLMFGVELAAPFLIFAPRRLRMIAAAVLAVLQLLILLTGNYTFFNWLTLLLCVLLLDDFLLCRWLPRRLTHRFARAVESKPPGPRGGRRWFQILTLPAAGLVIGISLIQVLAPFGPPPRWSGPLVSTYHWLAPLRSLNHYGLFAVMTTERPEIVVEGSNDGWNWKAYEFPHKPGALNRRPSFVAPHQPRLDWQMWFAALGNVQQNPWFANFCVHLLHGSPDVLALLETNPFPDRPPTYVRARLYRYHFTTPAERDQTGDWWKRELLGDYLSPISLGMFQPPAGSRYRSRENGPGPR